jgi:hypothetical protein
MAQRARTEFSRSSRSHQRVAARPPHAPAIRRTEDAALDVRAGLLLVGLFIASLVAFGGLQFTRQNIGSGLQQQSTETNTTASSDPRGAANVPMQAAAAVSAGDPSDGKGNPPKIDPGPRATADATPVAPPRASAEQKEWVRTALTSPELESRVAAIDRLRETDSPETTYGLTQVLASDPSKEARLLAIASLKTVAASRLDPDGAVRAALLAAASDPDRDIALDARMAYDEVQAAVGP